MTVDEAIDILRRRLAHVTREYRKEDEAFDVLCKAARAEPFQKRVRTWTVSCFGEVIAGDRTERSHRFIEEALELVQATGTTASEAHQLVDYVYGRPVGELRQEVGGALSTLAALCNAHRIDMTECGDTELARCWIKIEKIRAKQAAKPKYSPLPEARAQCDGGTCGAGGYCKKCPNATHMAEHACANRTQCWEPCGDLGKSEHHARDAGPTPFAGRTTRRTE